MREPYHQPVSGSKNVMDLCFKLRKGLLAPLGYATNAVDSHDGSSRAVHHAPRMKEILNEFHLSLVEHLMEGSPHQLRFSRQFIRELLIRHLDFIQRPTYHATASTPIVIVPGP